MAHFERTHPDGVWEDIGAPTIDSVSPSTGSGGGTNVFVITGTNLQYALEVNSSGNAFDSWVVDSPTQITVTTSSLNPPGAVDIEIVTDTGSVNAPAAYTYS